jgi:hypothetical protein
MIFWSSNSGFRLFGCGALLLLSILIAVVVFVLSGGACTVFIFP